MSLLFWGLAATMSLVAIGLIAIPLRTGNSISNRALLAVLVLVPIVAIGFYTTIGSPDAITSTIGHSDQDRAAAASTRASRGDKSIGSVASMLKGLEDRLEREPDDAGSWLLLAKSYAHLDQSAKAIAAYERARSLGKSDADLERSLLNAGASLQELPLPVRPALHGQVVLSPAAAALVLPGDTVFIFAKESLQHRMPIVALRRSAADLPIEFTLTDADAMVAGTHLADFEQLVVTAKISRSGLATDVVEGLETWSNAVSTLDNEIIELLITTDGGNE